ncbi:hypothetical protein [Streptomyces canus]|uniref:hypothetical protein n=1 Tax=Streptomyces canus TaxID=58343 RepID=UPI002780D477|nr:hypothetical protein [Streptomyces canus]MDQ0763577.1 hypothetical protein [Streptomyces canus]MDQ1067933.1 hypothetical protein [Streptomyces canus]
MTVDAELQIHEVRSATATEATVVVRCLRGPVRLGARFSLVRDTRAPIDLTVTSIVRYNRPDRAVDPGHSALVTLRGTGAQELRPTIGETGREIMPVAQGDNPAAP